MKSYSRLYVVAAVMGVVAGWMLMDWTLESWRGGNEAECGLGKTRITHEGGVQICVPR